MKKISRRNFLKVSGAMAAAGALAACGGSGASTPAASGAASTSTAASAAAAGEDKFASLGDFTMTVGHAQPEGNPRFVSIYKDRQRSLAERCLFFCTQTGGTVVFGRQIWYTKTTCA